MPTVSTGTALRSAIQAVNASDPTITLAGADPTVSFSSAITLGKRSSTNPAPFAYTGYTIQGAGISAATSATLQDTQIYQQNTDSAFLPGTVQNLTLNYSSSSNGKPLLSIEPKGAQTPTQSLTIKNVNFTGTTTGWTSNGNLYMSLRSFSNTSPLKTTFTLDNVNVAISGQNSGFTSSPTTGGSAFFHNWNNSGVVTIKDSIFDEGGFRASFNFNNFGALTSTPTNVISGNTFKRTSNVNVRDEGNRLQNVTATLSSNIFSDGSYVDLYQTISGITFNGNTFNTIANGYGIRVTSPITGANPTFSGTNTFTGPGLALKYVSATANDAINYSGSFNVGTKSFARLIACGQVNDNLDYSTLTGTNLWISADSGDDAIVSSTGADSLIGGAGNDILTSNAGTDTIDGGDGNDSLDGGGGTDILVGGADNDTLIGGLAVDTLTGGTGADTFLWTNGAGNDVITDFTAGDGDKIALTNIPFLPNPATVPGPINSLTFQTLASFTNVTSTNINGKIALLTNSGLTLGAAGNANSVMGFLAPTATSAGYILFFDTTTSKGRLVYDTNWRDTGNRVVAFTFDNLTTLGSVTSLTSSQFTAIP